MTSVEIYTFPTVESSSKELETAFCKLLNKYRQEGLTPEEQDWMDWANTVLMAEMAGSITV